MSLRESPPRTGFGHWFSRAASIVAGLTGTPWAFLLAISVIVTWAVTGPIFGFSDTWQLVINTGTTIVTFLMVFLIQNTQNRDARAMHLKLDELIRAVPQARNEFMEAEEEDLDEIEREKKIVDRADPRPPAHKREEAQPKQARPASGRGQTLPTNGKARGA
ncbi:MAG TPA: low affinity iron permease family protein [Candidatus Limnocylindrales bacterium]|nr:low affinity iron permease family protein [Candidatus Limnocylindrales bacterium]